MYDKLKETATHITRSIFFLHFYNFFYLPEYLGQHGPPVPPSASMCSLSLHGSSSPPSDTNILAVCDIVIIGCVWNRNYLDCCKVTYLKKNFKSITIWLSQCNIIMLFFKHRSSMSTILTCDHTHNLQTKRQRQRPGGGSSWWSAPPELPPTRPLPSGRPCGLECQSQEPSQPGWQSWSQIYPEIWYRLTFITVATSAPPTILRPHGLFPSLWISSSTTWQQSWKLIWGQRIRNLGRICQCLKKYHSILFIFFVQGFQIN